MDLGSPLLLTRDKWNVFVYYSEKSIAETFELNALGAWRNLLFKIFKHQKVLERCEQIN